MSRLRERLEKNCLNCNTEVEGRFCQNCGQENIETKETVWQLGSHFFKDITHFDGKFFNTLKYLFLKPGFISSEYYIGKRANYVNPVRMYIFTSFFFFLIFFSFFKLNQANILTMDVYGKTMVDIKTMDSLTLDDFTKKINKERGFGEKPMNISELNNYMESSFDSSGFKLFSTTYQSKDQYDSLIKIGVVKHSWLKRKIIFKELEIHKKYRNNRKESFRDFFNILLHSLPQMFFVSLPIFAFLLHLLYIRRRAFYYVSHSIFAVHFYIFSFIIMLFMFGLNKLSIETNWEFIKYLQTFLGFGILFYLYKAMRRFYKQRRAKTILKFFILFLLFLVTILFLFTFFLLFSFYKL